MILEVQWRCDGLRRKICWVSGEPYGSVTGEARGKRRRVEWRVLLLSVKAYGMLEEKFDNEQDATAFAEKALDNYARAQFSAAVREEWTSAGI